MRKPRVKIDDFGVEIIYQAVEGEYRSGCQVGVITTPTYQVLHGNTNVGVITSIDLLKLNIRIRVMFIGKEFRKQVDEWVINQTVEKEAYRCVLDALNHTTFGRLLKKVANKSFDDGVEQGKAKIREGFLNLMDLDLSNF